jgi:hypothetical protein
MDYAFLSNQPEMRNAKKFVGNEKGPVIAIVDFRGQGLIAIWPVVKGLRDTAKTDGISCLMETVRAGRPMQPPFAGTKGDA